MPLRVITGATVALAATLAAPASAQPASITPNAVTASLVGRLDLERYKATIKGLTAFGDRLEGTERNRRAVDWIEAQLKSYGCPTERLKYVKAPPAPSQAASAATRPAAGRTEGPPTAVGGGRPRGVRTSTTPNTDSARQADERLRALNAEPSVPGPRELVYCTKVGARFPNEMYIVGAHMDGRGFGEAANDDGSGTALVMELARIFSMPDVVTERTIRFALWNSEEGGLVGARRLRRAAPGAAGKGGPAGVRPVSGADVARHGSARHDAVRSRHAARRRHDQPGAAARGRRQHRVPDEVEACSRSQKLAWYFHAANAKYATDYPAQVGPHMTNTDSTPFMDVVASISLRENERGVQVGSGWDPHWHQPTDLFTTFSRQGFPARPERRADHARRHRGPYGDDAALAEAPAFEAALLGGAAKAASPPA